MLKELYLFTIEIQCIIVCKKGFAVTFGLFVAYLLHKTIILGLYQHIKAPSIFTITNKSSTCQSVIPLAQILTERKKVMP